mgnify:CR=1 FL=1
MNWKKWFVSWVVLAVGFWGLPVLGEEPYPVSPENPITIEIGVLLPLTGSLSGTGTTALYTLEVAKTEFLKEFPTVTIQETIADTQSNPDVALQELQKMAQQGIRVFVGPCGSEEIARVKSFVDQYDLIVISPTSTAPSLSVNDRIFRVSPNDAKQALALAAWIHRKTIDVVIPIGRDDTYGRDLIEQFQSQFQALGGGTSEPIYYDVTTSDFSSIVSQAENAMQGILDQNPGKKIGILAVSYNEIVDLFHSASGSDLLSNVSWFGTDAAAENEQIAEDSSAAVFARKTNFTASIFSYNALQHPYLPFSNLQENLVSKVLLKYSPLEESHINAIYDAYWLAGMMQFDSNAPDLKNELVRISKQVVGMIGPIDFNEVGDRDYGYFAFFQFMDAGWIETAAYHLTKYNYGLTDPITEFTFNTVATDKTIKIGILLSLTGVNSSMSKGILSAIEKAKVDIDMVLSRYYSSNSTVELIVENTNSDPETAYAKIVELKNQGIQYVIGPNSSAELARVASYATENGMLILSPASTAMSMALQDHVFRLTLTDDKQSKALAILAQDLGYTHVEILYRDDSYGQSFTQYFTEYFQSLGGTCGTTIAYDSQSSDFQSAIAKAEAQVTTAVATYGLNHTAVLIVAIDEVTSILESISTSSILSQVRWFGTDGIAQNSVFTDHPAAVAFAQKTKLIASCMGTGTDALVVPSEVMGNELTDHLGDVPKAFDVAGYDAAWIFALYSIYSDWYPLSDSQKLADDFLFLINKTVGYLSYNFVNEMGDRQFGDIEFFQPVAAGDSVNWNKIASYVYFLTESGPYYFDAIPSSSVELAPFFR